MNWSLHFEHRNTFFCVAESNWQVQCFSQEYSQKPNSPCAVRHASNTSSGFGECTSRIGKDRSRRFHEPVCWQKNKALADRVRKNGWRTEITKAGIAQWRFSSKLCTMHLLRDYSFSNPSRWGLGVQRSDDARDEHVIVCSLPNSSIQVCEKYRCSKTTCPTFATCKRLTPKKVHLKCELRREKKLYKSLTTLR